MGAARGAVGAGGGGGVWWWGGCCGGGGNDQAGRALAHALGCARTARSRTRALWPWPWPWPLICRPNRRPLGRVGCGVATMGDTARTSSPRPLGALLVIALASIWRRGVVVIIKLSATPGTRAAGRRWGRWRLREDMVAHGKVIAACPRDPQAAPTAKRTQAERGAINRARQVAVCLGGSVPWVE